MPDPEPRTLPPMAQKFRLMRTLSWAGWLCLTLVIKGGAKNVINCRCVTLYIDPDDEVIQDEDTVVPQKPIKEPLPERNITAPIEPAVTALTFKMVTRLEAQKSLTAEFAEAAKDDRYLNKKNRHYRGRGCW